MSLNEVRSRARGNNISHILSEETSEFHGFQPWDGKNPQAALVPRRFAVENHTSDAVEVQPLSGFNAGTFLNGAVIDYRLDNHDVSVVDSMMLAVNITNSTGAGVTLPPTPFWVDKLELLGPSSNVLATFYDTDLWAAILCLPRNDFEQLAAYMSTNTAYSTAGVVIANGASSELYLPIIPLVHACRLHLPGINGSLTWRFRMKSSANILIAGTHPTVTSALMLLQGADESANKRSLRTAYYKGQIARFQNTPLYLPFFTTERFVYTQTLAASTRYNIKLSGFQGQFAALWVIARALPLTAANQGTFLQLADFTVQTAGGENLAGNHIKSHVRSRIIAAGQLQNLAAANSNFYMLPFSQSVVQDLIVGSSSGFQVLEGTENLIFSTTAATAPGSYELLVIGFKANALRIQKGQVEKRA